MVRGRARSAPHGDGVDLDPGAARQGRDPDGSPRRIRLAQKPAVDVIDERELAEVDEIAGWDSLDPQRCQTLAQAKDLRLQRADVVAGQRPTPQFLGEAVGREIEFVELTVEEAHAKWRGEGMPEGVIAFLTEALGNTPVEGKTVSDTVERVTGRPALTFSAWATANADAFK